MSRTDRLLSLMQLMRDGRLHRAEDLARTLGVSVRTIYRDMEVLTQSGIPVEGERGLGYQITAAITLPPLNLSKLELEALHLGLAIVGDGADADLQAAAKSLSAKVDAVLPEDGTARPRGFGFAVYPLSGATRGFDHMPAMRAAIRTRQKLRVSYPGADGVPEVQVIRPLSMDYWGRVWTAVAWSEAREGFVSLRMDRIEALTILPQLFVEEPGKTLEDYRATAGAAS